VTIPSTPTPARPVDDAIIETGWGAWAHDLHAQHPVLQTVQFTMTLASGGGAKVVNWVEAYPAGWTVAVAGLVAPMITGNAATLCSAFSPTLTGVTIRVEKGTYSGNTNPGYVTGIGFPPGPTNLGLWRYGTGALLRDALEGALEGADLPAPQPGA